MSLSSLRVLDNDVTNVPARDSAFRPKIKVRPRRGQTATPAPEAPPAQADDVTVRPEPPDAAERPETSLRGARTQQIPEAGRPQLQDSVLPPVAPPLPEQVQRGANQPAAAPVVIEGANQTAGAKRRIPHSTTGGRRRAAFRGPPEYDDHTLNPGEVNTTGMTLKEILRMADAKEKERNLDDVRRPAREEEDEDRPAEDRQAPARAPEEPDVRALAPQIRIVDGQIVVDQQSLTASAQASNPVVSHNFRRVEESGSRLNSNTYSNRKPTKRWTDQDTVVFYKALRQFGTDFTTIQKLFPTRTRHQIKNKYLTEDRQHPKAIEAALNHKSRDRSHYEDMIARLQAATNDEAAEEGTQEPVSTSEQNNGSSAAGAQRPQQGATLSLASGPSGPGVTSSGLATGVNETVAAGSQMDGQIRGPMHTQQDATQLSSALRAGVAPTQESQVSRSRAVPSTAPDESPEEVEASGPFSYLQQPMRRTQ